MMTYYSVYDATGRILRSGYCPTTQMTIQAQSGESVIDSPGDDATQYVVDGAVVDRPTFSLQPNATELTPSQTFRVDNIPAGTSVKYPDGDVVIDDGFLEWTSAVEGIYSFTFRNFPYAEEIIYAEFRYL